MAIFLSDRAGEGRLFSDDLLRRCCRVSCAAFFADRHIGRKEKIVGAVLLAFLLLCSFWLPGYIFLHCFDAPDLYGYRFGFLYCFLLTAVCSIQWNRTEGVSSKKLVMIAVFNIVIYYLVYLWQGQTLEEEYQSASILGWEMDTALQTYYKNENALGLGYMVSEGFREISLQDNAMENLNLVIQGMTGENIVCMIPYMGDITLRSENII